MRKHALVTGGSGFIGSHLVDALIQRGFEVTVIDLKGAEDIEHANSEATYIKSDLTNKTTIDRIISLKPDLIFHFAANANVAKSMAEPLYDYAINYGATAHLLEAASYLGMERFIFASTGGGLSSEQTILPTPEHLICKPLSPYALHKLASEQLGDIYRTHKGLPFIALRFSNVYGPRQTSTNGEANVIATFAERMARNQDTRINGNGLQTRDYVYVTDAVEACLKVLHNGMVQTPLNIGSGIETDVRSIHRLLAHHYGYTRTPQICLPDVGAPMRSCLDISKAKNMLDWSPRIFLAEGLARTAEWHLERERQFAGAAA